MNFFIKEVVMPLGLCFTFAVLVVWGFSSKPTIAQPMLTTTVLTIPETGERVFVLGHVNPDSTCTYCCCYLPPEKK